MANDFKIAHLNIRGIKHKIDQVKVLLFSHNFKIFCLSETFLEPDRLSIVYEIPGYDLIRKDRGSGGGGLLCYIDSSIKYDRQQVLDDLMGESITLKIIQTVSRPFIVSFIYRPPDSLVSWNSKFVDHVEQCSAVCGELMFLGDFNINLLEPNLKKRWFKNIAQFGLTQFIEEPTRVTETTATLIDHIYSNRSINIRSSSVVRCTLSDHYLVWATRKIGVPNSDGRIKVSFRDYIVNLPQKIVNNYFRISIGILYYAVVMFMIWLRCLMISIGHVCLK